MNLKLRQKRFGHLKVLFAVCLCFASFNAVAQLEFEIKNKVSDFLTFMPIESASVYVKNSTVGTISNSDGKFVLIVPGKHAKDTLIVSSIGYKSFKIPVEEFDNSMEIFLEEDVASLDEVVLIAETRPKTGNDIMLRVVEELEDNLPEYAYLQKGFVRHTERNKKEYRWLIESAITLYDSSYAAGAKKHLRINVDETRKSYDLRDVDSLYTYTAYLRYARNIRLKSRTLFRDTIETASLVKAIKWNDRRVNGLDNLFKGRLNMVRNANTSKALFGKDILAKHQFDLDTVLVENERKVYKIRISKGSDFVGLGTPNIYNEGFEAKGWVYIDWDTYAVKRIEYELFAASEQQKRRSKSLYDTLLNHRLIMTFKEYQGKMYPSYIYYETPKLVNAGDRSSDRDREDYVPKYDKDEQFYYTIQEILFTEIIQDPEIVKGTLAQDWSDDIFSPQPYNEEFWRSYNVLLESEEEEKLIQDLTKRATLFKQ